MDAGEIALWGLFFREKTVEKHNYLTDEAMVEVAKELEYSQQEKLVRVQLLFIPF